MKRERGSMRERSSRFIECYATGSDSADLVSFTNKRPCINTVTKPNVHTHMHTHIHTCTGLWTFTHPLKLKPVHTSVIPTHLHTCLVFHPASPFSFLLPPISLYRMTSSNYSWLFIFRSFLQGTGED